MSQPDLVIIELGSNDWTCTDGKWTRIPDEVFERFRAWLPDHTVSVGEGWAPDGPE